MKSRVLGKDELFLWQLQAWHANPWRHGHRVPRRSAVDRGMLDAELVCRRRSGSRPRGDPIVDTADNAVQDDVTATVGGRFVGARAESRSARAAAPSSWTADARGVSRCTKRSANSAQVPNASGAFAPANAVDDNRDRLVCVDRSWRVAHPHVRSPRGSSEHRDPRPAVGRPTSVRLDELLLTTSDGRCTSLATSTGSATRTASAARSARRAALACGSRARPLSAAPSRRRSCRASMDGSERASARMRDALRALRVGSRSRPSLVACAPRLASAPQIERRRQAHEHRALSRRVRAPRVRTRERDPPLREGPRSSPGEPTTHGQGVCSPASMKTLHVSRDPIAHGSGACSPASETEQPMSRGHRGQSRAAANSVRVAPVATGRARSPSERDDHARTRMRAGPARADSAAVARTARLSRTARERRRPSRLHLLCPGSGHSKTHTFARKCLTASGVHRRVCVARTSRSSSRKRCAALLANVLVPSALRAGRNAFARAERTPERRKPPC